MRRELVFYCIIAAGVILAGCDGDVGLEGKDAITSPEPTDTGAPIATTPSALLVIGCGGGEFESGNITGE